jgi:hypothetical protein
MKRILYIVGAGLTKALQQTAQVPLMADFVSVMSHHLDDPVIAEILARYEQDGVFQWPSTTTSVELAKRILHGDTDGLVDFGNALRNRPSENIETLLEDAIKRGPDVANLFKRAINRVFWRLHSSLNLDLLRRFVAHQTQLTDTEHHVISFNYDLSLETVLQESGNWHPATGYGLSFPDFLDPSEIEKTRAEEAVGGEPRLRAKMFPTLPSSQWRLLKPHGSLNWVWSYMRLGPLGLNVVASENGGIAYASDITIPGSWRAGPVSLVPFGFAIAPPGAKNLFEQRTADRGDRRGELIAQLQHEAIRRADEIIVIGWSLPLTDAYHAALLHVCCEERRRSLERAVIVNFRAPIDYYIRLKTVLSGPRVMEVHNQGFASYVDSLERSS